MKLLPTSKGGYHAKTAQDRDSVSRMQHGHPPSGKELRNAACLPLLSTDKKVHDDQDADIELRVKRQTARFQEKLGSLSYPESADPPKPKEKEKTKSKQPAVRALGRKRAEAFKRLAAFSPIRFIRMRISFLNRISFI